jgi:PKD repeat protein
MLSTDDYGIVSWNWTLGDGTTGSGPIVNHTYSASGSYPVTLTVTDGAGQNSSASITATVTTNQPPVARFKYSCSISTLKCTFDASASTDDHGVVGYLWHSSLAGKPDKTGVKIVRIFSRGQVWWETITLTDAQGLTSKLTRKVVTP